MDNEKEIEISLKDILGIIKRGLWIVVVTAVVFGVAAFGYSKFFVQKTYTSTMKLYVQTQSEDEAGAYNVLSSHNYAKDLVNTYIEMLDTNSFYESLSIYMDSKYTAKQLSSMISYDNSSETEVFTMSFVADTPTEAKLVADKAARIAPSVISGLKDNATLRIVDEAVIPMYPTSPNITKNTILAFLIGTALSLIFIFVRSFLDTKIKYDPDVTEYDNIPVLAAIPDFDGPAKNLNMLTLDNESSNTSQEVM